MQTFYTTAVIIVQLCKYEFTFIKPAKQCKSTPSGTTPRFKLSLTYTSWLLSAFILNIPSAWKHMKIILSTNSKIKWNLDTIRSNYSTKYATWRPPCWYRCLCMESKIVGMLLPLLSKEHCIEFGETPNTLTLKKIKILINKS